MIAAACLWGELCGRPQVSLDEAISLAVAAEYEEALRMFTARLREDPDDPLLNYYVGISCYKLSRLSEAILYFERALENAPQFPQVYFWATKAYLEKEMPAEARRCLSDGLRRFPANEDLLDLSESLKEAVEETLPGGSGRERPGEGG